MKIQFYNQRFHGIPVTFAGRDVAIWQRIIGIQVGGCFIGVIRSRPVQERPPGCRFCGSHDIEDGVVDESRTRHLCRPCTIAAVNVFGKYFGDGPREVKRDAA